MKRRDWKQAEGMVEQVYLDAAGSEGEKCSVVFTYKVDGSWFGGTFTALDNRHYAGEKIPVWYDPSDPDRNHLVQREKVLNWALVVFFVAFGIFFVYSFIRSMFK